jgi:HD superfamily phosphohydrolase
MTLEIVRRIRGNLHGSIDVSALEDLVIDHPLFQRLRRVHQTAFLSYVFPGATHSRFEHSLGVMHLAGVAWQKLEANQHRLKVSTRKYENFKDREIKESLHENHGMLAPTFDLMGEVFSSSYILQALRLAALLHDVGHPPFSHSGERFLPSLESVLAESKDLPGYLNQFLNQLQDSWIECGRDPKTEAVSHEIFTVILVDRLLEDVYSKNKNIKTRIEMQDVVSIIMPEIPPVDGSPLLAMKVHHACHEIVSGEIDVDRMDYLQRDSRECGVVYGIFDADRILDSLSLYQDPISSNLHLAIQYTGLAAFEDYLRARQSMYLQLYFHKTSVAAEAMLQNIFSKMNNWRLPVDVDEYTSIDEYNILVVLKEALVERVKDEEVRVSVLGEIDDLLVKRQLWKRVFEITGSSDEIRHNETTEKAKLAIKKLGYHFEQVSSASSLTKFRPRAKNQESKNYLRLIKKDSKQFLRVFPIEDFSELISNQNSVHITRLYVKNKTNKDGQKDSTVIKKAITSAFDE